MPAGLVLQLRQHALLQAAALPGAVEASLTLELTIEDVGGAGTPARTAFESSFKADLASSLDGVVSSQVVITSVTVGSVVVDFVIIPGADGVAIPATIVETALSTDLTIAGATPTLTAPPPPPAVAPGPSSGASALSASLAFLAATAVPVLAF